jgi:hypothetical protein
MRVLLHKIATSFDKQLTPLAHLFRQRRIQYLKAHGPAHRIKEVVMAKVIEFYVPKNFRKPLKWVPQLQLGRIISFCSLTKKSA